MRLARYLIDGKEIAIPYFNDDIALGADFVISNELTDLSFRQDWYPEGFKIYQLFGPEEFNKIRRGVEIAVASVIEEELNINLTNFNLLDYHKFVVTDAEHIKVVSRTRDLFYEDFNFPIHECIEKLSQIVRTNLSDFNPETNKRIHIIIRINRPNSTDFNPPHKDIYGSFDKDPAMRLNYMNFWIPICGVTDKSSLPIVPSSHLIPESQIRRSRSGALLSENRYRVNIILNWKNATNLTRTAVKEGKVLCFSPHLIHGLAVNHEPDQTRVALEFRLLEAT